MTNLKTLASDIPNYAADIRSNLTKLISEDNKLLTPKQIFGAALAAAYAAKEKSAITDLKNEARFHLSNTEMEVIKTATSNATMNNIYRIFVDATQDPEFDELHVALSNDNAQNHTIDKIDFEVFSLATSIINCCRRSIKTHVNKLTDLGLTKQQIQMIAKIVAVVGSSAQILTIEEII